MALTWHVGDTARLRCTFTVSGVDTDPTAVTLSIMDPAGTITDYDTSTSVERESAGVYGFDLALSSEGSYRWRWEGTGSCAAADEGVVTVSRSVFS